MLDLALEFSNGSRMNRGRAEKQREHLIDLDASLEEAEATKKSQLRTAANALHKRSASEPAAGPGGRARVTRA